MENTPERPIIIPNSEKFDAEGKPRTLRVFPDNTTGFYSDKEYADMSDTWEHPSE